MNNNVANGLIDFNESYPNNSSSFDYSSLNKLRGENLLEEEFKTLVKLCQSESDLLKLRSNIISNEYSNFSKADLLEKIDDYVLFSISSHIEKASKLQEYKSEVRSMYMGMIAIIIIGLFVSSFFPIAGPISLVLVILGFLGSTDRKKLKESKKSSLIVKRYRDAGYPVDIMLNSLQK